MNPELEIEGKKTWLTENQPYIIAGPCSVESEEQVLSTAQQIKQHTKANVLRGGIWKPRTRPNSFEGIGSEGLQWLKDAGNQVGLPVATEVAKAAHVELCLEAGIDMLWIGARTTVNPFSVQEIADALRGVDIPVMVKNPITPDLNLWIGALERVNAAGIHKLGAIHRGFSSYDKSVYRNVPMWELPIALKMSCPSVPLLCDPSHIAGNKTLIGRVSQKALDLEMDGLMIESHVDPGAALSDSQQQLTPIELSNSLASLHHRTSQSESTEFVANLEHLRTLIDELDEDIIEKFAARMDVVEKIGTYKKENDVVILQLERWEYILKARTELATEAGISAEFIQKLLDLIHQESIRIQTKVMNK